MLGHSLLSGWEGAAEKTFWENKSRNILVLKIIYMNVYMYLLGEVKANVYWQEPALAGGCRCYLQALADTRFSGQRLIPETEALMGPQGICFQKLTSEQSSQVHSG